MTLAGVGIGWRPELAGFAARRDGLGFVEVVAEGIHEGQPLPAGLAALLARGVPVVPHGVRLSLGSAEEPDPGRVAHLTGLVERLAAPLVSEHVAFVRGGGLEAGHLLPVPRTREVLDVLAGNVRLAQAELPVPLALEHVAALLEWPAPELDEADFLTQLLDVANLYANARNHGGDPLALPLQRIAYVHVAGGLQRDGLYHDTHAHPTRPPSWSWSPRSAADSPGDHPGGPPGPPAATRPGSCWSATTTIRPSKSWPRSWTRSPPPPAPERPAGEPGRSGRRVRGTPGGCPRCIGRDWRPSRRRWSGRFLADAARRPPPARGGALADGLAFADALAREGRLPDSAPVERLAARAHLLARPVRLAATLAGPPRRLVVTVRAPGVGERWLSVPLGRAVMV